MAFLTQINHVLEMIWSSTCSRSHSIGECEEAAVGALACNSADQVEECRCQRIFYYTFKTITEKEGQCSLDIYLEMGTF